MAKQIFISSVEDFEQLRHLKYDKEYVVRITADIKFDASKSFEPIDLSEFKGVLLFKGENYVLKDFTIDAPNQDYVGLFSIIGTDADVTMKNVIFENPNIKGRVNVGTIAGQGSIVLRDCKVIGGTINGQSIVGGFCGLSTLFGTYDCEASTCVTACATAGAFVGASENIVFQNETSASLVTTMQDSENKLYGVAWGVTKIQSFTRPAGDEDVKLYLGLGKKKKKKLGI